MKSSIALAFVVTVAFAVAFIALGFFTVIAAARWVLADAETIGLLRAAGLWAVSFLLMQGWSYYLRHAAAPGAAE